MWEVCVPVSTTGWKSFVKSEFSQGVMPQSDVNGGSGDAIIVEEHMDGFKREPQMEVVFLRDNGDVTEGHQFSPSIRVPRGGSPCMFVHPVREWSLAHLPNATDVIIIVLYFVHHIEVQKSGESGFRQGEHSTECLEGDVIDADLSWGIGLEGGCDFLQELTCDSLRSLIVARSKEWNCAREP